MIQKNVKNMKSRGEFYTSLLNRHNLDSLLVVAVRPLRGQCCMLAYRAVAAKTS